MAATPQITTRWQCHPVTYSSLLRKALRSVLLSITVRVWVSVQSFINPLSHITDHTASLGFTICTVKSHRGQTWNKYPDYRTPQTITDYMTKYLMQTDHKDISYLSFSDSPLCWCWTCRSAARCDHWSCCTGSSWQSWDGLGCHWPPVAPVVKRIGRRCEKKSKTNATKRRMKLNSILYIRSWSFTLCVMCCCSAGAWPLGSIRVGWATRYPLSSMMKHLQCAHTSICKDSRHREWIHGNVH